MHAYGNQEEFLFGQNQQTESITEIEKIQYKRNPESVSWPSSGLTLMRHNARQDKTPNLLFEINYTFFFIF